MTSSNPQIAPFLQELLCNADALLRDAEVLFENQRWARTLVLATLAREEAGKVVLVVSGQMPNDDSYDLRPTRHEDKLTTAALTQLAFLGDLNDLPTQARLVDGKASHREKLSALYVDLREDGIHSPSSVSRDRAEEVLIEAKNFVIWIRQTFEQVSTDALDAAVQLTSTLGPRLDAYVQVHGEVAGLELARDLLAWSNALAVGDTTGVAHRLPQTGTTK